MGQYYNGNDFRSGSNSTSNTSSELKKLWKDEDTRIGIIGMASLLIEAITGHKFF